MGAQKMRRQSQEDNSELDLQPVSEFENAGFGEAGQWAPGH